MNKYSLRKRGIQVVVLAVVVAGFFTVYTLAIERIAQLENRAATEMAQVQATVTAQATLLTTVIKADTLQETAVATPNLQVTPDISSSVLDEPQPTENNQETLAYRLAHEAALALDEEPTALERGMLLAVEAVQRYPSVQTIQRLREGISLLRPRKLTIYSDDFFAHVTHSPDGRFIAAFNIDNNQVHVFSVENGDEIARLSYENPNRPFNIDSMVFSQNGEYLAGVDGVGWDDNTVIVWELSTEDAIWQHSEQNTNISALAFNDDNVHFGFIARGQITSETGAQSQNAQIWSLETNTKLMELPTNANSLAFSQDGNSVFTFNNGVYQWNMTTGQNTLLFSTDEAESFAGVYFSPQYNYLMRTDIREIFTIPDGLQIQLEYPLKSVDHFSEPLFSPNEKYLATVSSFVQVWDAASGREIFKIENNNNYVRDIAFSPNSQYLAVSFGYFVRVWDVRNWQEVFRVSREAPVWDMAFTPDGRHFITSGHGVGSRIDVWALEVPLLQQNFAYEEYLGEIWSVQYSPDGSYLAVGTENGLVYLHDTQNKNTEIARLEHNDRVRLLDFSVDGRYLLASAIRFQADSSTIYLWDIGQESVVFTNTHAALVENMAFSPNGDYFLTADSLYTTTTRIFSTATGKEVATLPETGFMEAFFSEDGRFLCTASFETVKVWRTGTWELLMEVAGDQAEISPDGQLLATSGPRLTSNDIVKVWQIPNKEEVMNLPTDRWVNDLKFSPNGQYLAIAIGQAESGGLQVWDVLHQESVMVTARGDGIENIAFSPDSQYIAFSNEGYQTDDLIWIWNVQNRREIARWWQSGLVSQLTFSPDGQQLLSVSGLRTIHVWEWQPKRLVAEACRRLTRNFTQQEWQFYFGNEPYSSTCPNLANP